MLNTGGGGSLTTRILGFGWVRLVKLPVGVFTFCRNPSSNTTGVATASGDVDAPLMELPGMPSQTFVPPPPPDEPVGLVLSTGSSGPPTG
ncbi:MAG: hypothetical protein WBG38_14445, partial [Nodosilinea sp.]